MGDRAAQRHKTSRHSAAESEAESGAGSSSGQVGGCSGGSGIGCVHVVVGVPLTLVQLSADHCRRDELYQLSQLVVTTLWRSNLGEIIHASGGTSFAPHATSSVSAPQLDSDSPTQVTHRGLLSISFACGHVMHADQRLVYHMASQHQAAPSEYQILAVLQAAIANHERQDAEGAEGGGREGGWCAGPGGAGAREGTSGVAGIRIVRTSGSGKAVGKSVLREHKTKHFSPCVYCLDVIPAVRGTGVGGGAHVLDLAAAAYKIECECRARRVDDMEPKESGSCGGETVVMAIMWVGDAQGRGAGGKNVGCARQKKERGWRERVCRYMLKASCKDSNGLGAQDLRTVRLGPPLLCPSPQVSFLSLATCHESYLDVDAYTHRLVSFVFLLTRLFGVFVCFCGLDKRRA